MLKNLSKIFLIATIICIVVYISVFMIRTNIAPDFPNINMENAEDQDFQKIDLNTATAKELSTIPGVDASIANAIVAYREEYGRYYKLKELLDIDGVTQELFESLKSYVTVYD